MNPLRMNPPKPLLITLGFSVCLCLATAGVEAQPRSETVVSARGSSARPILPRSWHAADFEVSNQRYTLEVARFPSTALAGGVRMAMENMGWSPLQQKSVDGEELIYLGNFGSVAYATYVARDLAAQKIATGRVVELPEGLSFSSVGIEGPLIEPFVPTNREDSRLLSEREAVRQMGMLADNLPPRISDPARLALERLAMESDWSSYGDDVGEVAVELARLKTNAPLAFYLARRVASGEWSAPRAVRVAAGEVAADLQYGWLRDWRGAWASSVALLEDPARDGAGRARDRLRLAALEVELASSGSELRPSWNRVRLQLRRAWDEVPLDAEREQAKIELVYLQTFAWQGNWARVEELGRDHAARYGTRFPHEGGLAKLMLARALERREEWEAALEILDRHFAGRPLPAQDGLFMGFDRLDLAARYRETRERLANARTVAESQAIAERVARINREVAE